MAHLMACQCQGEAQQQWLWDIEFGLIWVCVQKSQKNLGIANFGLATEHELNLDYRDFSGKITVKWIFLSRAKILLKSF